MKKLKIVCVCGFGVGSSLILKMKVDEVLQEFNIVADCVAQDVTSATSMLADVVFASKDIVSQLEGRLNCPLIVINNFLDKEEIRDKGLELLQSLVNN